MPLNTSTADTLPPFATAVASRTASSSSIDDPRLTAACITCGTAPVENRFPISAYRRTAHRRKDHLFSCDGCLQEQGLRYCSGSSCNRYRPEKDFGSVPRAPSKRNCKPTCDACYIRGLMKRFEVDEILANDQFDDAVKEYVLKVQKMPKRHQRKPVRSAQPSVASPVKPPQEALLAPAIVVPKESTVNRVWALLDAPSAPVQPAKSAAVLGKRPLRQPVNQSMDAVLAAAKSGPPAMQSTGAERGMRRIPSEVSVTVPESSFTAEDIQPLSLGREQMLPLPQRSLSPQLTPTADISMNGFTYNSSMEFGDSTRQSSFYMGAGNYPYIDLGYSSPIRKRHRPEYFLKPESSLDQHLLDNHHNLYPLQ